MKRFPEVSDITPEQFELQVKTWLYSVSTPLEAFSATHRQRVAVGDGEYEIDVVARFKALGGADFVVLVECKKYRNSIKREIVLALRSKQLSIGAQKAIVVSTADFQSGAVEYAQKNGIALVQFISGAAMYIQANALNWTPQIPDDAEDYAGLFHPRTPDQVLRGITTASNYALKEFIDGD